MTRLHLTGPALAFALAGCSWGLFRADEPAEPTLDPEPVDTVAPALEVRPPGGAYQAVQYVTLAADEPATVHYTLDGSDPQGAGSAAAHVAPSPVFWLRVGAGTTVLRAVAVDAAGNPSAPVAETYVVDVPPADSTPPALTLLSAPTDPVPLLSTAAVSWRSDEAVTWRAELGGGVPGFGTLVATGSAAPGVPVTVEVHGWDVTAAPTTLWLHASDAGGLPASLAVSLAPAAPVPGAETGGLGGCWDLAVSGDGRRVFATAGAAVKVVDADPGSPTLDAVLATHAVQGDALYLAAAPGGAHVWVGAQAGPGDHGGLYAVATADGAVTVIVTTAGRGPHVGVTPDGARAYFITDSGAAASVDADPSSASFGADLRLAAGGDDGFIAFAGTRMAAGRVVLDVDPGSATRDQLLGWLDGSPYAFVAGPVASPEGTRFYAGTCPAILRAWDPVTRTQIAWGHLDPTEVNCLPWSLSTAGPDHLVAVREYGTTLSVLRTVDLTLARVPLTLPAGWTLQRLAVTPDGRRLYVLAATSETGPAACRLVRVPLR